MSSFDPFAEVRVSSSSAVRMQRAPDGGGSMTEGGWTKISYENGYEERGGGGAAAAASGGVAAAAARYAAPPSAAVAASSGHQSSSSNSAAAAASHRNSSQSPRVDSAGYGSGPVGSNGSSGSSGPKGSKGSHPSSASGSTAAAIRHTFQKPAVPVSLNVYDLHPYNQYLHGLGFGAYHSAVQIFGKEYSFGFHNSPETGVFSMAPKTVPNAVFRESIDAGEVYISLGQFNLILDQLKHEWPGNKYHLLRRNCNHFSKALLGALGLKAPSFINRLASAGDMLATVVPSFMLPKQVNMLIANGRPDMSSPEDDEIDAQQQAEGKDGMLRSIPPGRSSGGAGVPTLSSGMTPGGGGGSGGDWRQIAPQPSPDSLDDESFAEFLRASEKEYQREQEYQKLRAATQMAVAADQHAQAAAQIAKQQQHAARVERERREHGQHGHMHAHAHATQHAHQQSPQQHHRHHRSLSGSGSFAGSSHGSGGSSHGSSHGSGHGSGHGKPLSATETDELVDAAMAKFDLPEDVSESEKAQIRAVLRISIAAGAQS